MTLYMAVTADKYELPLAVTNTANELAKTLGKKTSYVRAEISRETHGKNKCNGRMRGYKLVKVEVEDGNKLKSKRTKQQTFPAAPLNIPNCTIQQISQTTGARIESLKAYLSAREDEIYQAATKEAREKLWKAEDYIAVANILISLLAIKMTWGFTKANQRFLENINPAKAYLERKGVQKVYEELHWDMGIELEFDSMDINREFGFGEFQKGDRN